MGLDEHQVVAHVEPHVTRGNRRQVKDTMKSDTEGNEKADELANMGADMYKASRTEWPASEMQDERQDRSTLQRRRNKEQRRCW